ncbi:precorrin-2 dehydrogenase/sirohydrochlorin ferrochelatase family protein [Effusibacillus dendaii]|uniref:precorrin-2 dehydrogenase n=1 Tax=Effusibacillus dendaii TaxID=2743772 RepID=A0A7I8D4K4_9BACL|nr:bifunctional precorrin-2 dehydrogenase/sirohydrochlorin ferrochelatase [Effusibacillus dendaii]BCJ85048.1 siroheme synthase [Effusibacillus dendaii]
MGKNWFGAFLDMSGQLCVVIGGGQVAERRVQSVLVRNAKVRVVSPNLTEKLTVLAERGQIEHIHRSFQPGDTRGAFLTIAATNSSSVNRQAITEARSEGRLANGVHAADEGNLLFPAVLERGPLQVAITTSGLGPALARLIREELESYFGDEYGTYLDKLASVRERLLQTIDEEPIRTEILRQIVRSDVRELLRERNAAEADRIIQLIIEGREKQ